MTLYICRGWKELNHELLQPYWLGHIKIKEPKELKNAVRDYLKTGRQML